jgi:hypothetical protein
LNSIADKRDRWRVRTKRVASAAAALLCACTAHAENYFKPYAVSDYFHDSNLFALSQDAAPAVGNAGPTRGDTLLMVGAGFDSNYSFGNQRMAVAGSASRLTYQQLDDLDHSEYVLSAATDWRVLRVVGGSLGYQVEHRVASVLEFDNADLLLETERIGKAALTIAVTPDWELGGDFKHRKDDSPRDGFPYFSVTETTVGAALRYAGTSGWSTALDAQRLEGRTKGVTGPFAVPYTQQHVGVSTQYDARGLYELALGVGYARRTQEAVQDVKAVTGTFGYTRVLTGKTSVSVHYDRAVETYLTNTNAQLSSGVTLGLTWNPTVKTSLAVSYVWQRSDFPGLSSDNVADGDRQDRYRLTTIEIKYHLADSLLLNPYARYQARHSTVERFTFDGTVFGLRLEAKLP